MTERNALYLMLRTKIRSPLYEVVFKPDFDDRFHGISTCFPSTIQEPVYEFGGVLKGQMYEQDYHGGEHEE